LCPSQPSAAPAEQGANNAGTTPASSSNELLIFIFSSNSSRPVWALISNDLSSDVQ
jgi:hypothetical protein